MDLYIKLIKSFVHITKTKDLKVTLSFEETAPSEIYVFIRLFFQIFSERTNHKSFKQYLMLYF